MQKNPETFWTILYPPRSPPILAHLQNDVSFALDMLHRSKGFAYDRMPMALRTNEAIHGAWLYVLGSEIFAKRTAMAITLLK